MMTGTWLAPVRRGLFEPLLQLKNGSPLRGHWSELEKTQYLPEAVLRERQWRKLGNLLRFAGEHNDFYRARFQAAGVTPGSIRSPEDLSLIPVLTKEEIRRNTDRMISRGFEKARLMHFKTGGSTGKPLDIYLTEECSELRNACARRHDRWAGWEVGEPIGAVWGNPKLPATLKEKLKNCLLTPLIYLDTMCLTRDSVKGFAAEWEKTRPTLLYGHAHSLYVLACYVRELGICTIRPKGILSTSMMLVPHERRAIEEVFGLKVTDRYGCEEVSLIASECERHEGMHLNIEHLFIEFLRDDGGAAAPGEPGRIVVTDLMNLAMPFIRYQVEDVGVPSDRKCSCGRALPLMEQINGRVADFLVRVDGTRVAGVSLIENTLTRFKGLEQMQIIQKRYDHFQLKIVPGSEYNEDVSVELSNYFRQTFGYEILLDLLIVDEIQQEKSGKYRFAICEVDSI